MASTDVGRSRSPLAGTAPPVVHYDRRQRRRRRALARRRRLARIESRGTIGGLLVGMGWSGLIAMLLVAMGIGLRLWFVFHVPVSGNEAAVGLVAQQINHDHQTTFLLGRPYGGAEAYLVAAAFGLAGPGQLALGIVAALLAVLAALATYLLARAVLLDRRLAVLGAAVAFAWPEATLRQSTVEGGFRGVALVCGLVALWLAIRIAKGAQRWADFAGLGLAVGLGWWASPEIAYVGVPVVLCALHASSKRRGSWDPPEALAGMRAVAGMTDGGPAPVPWFRWMEALVAALVGAAPWLVANLRSNFASLHTSAVTVPASLRAGYVGRLRDVGSHLLPVLLGVSDPAGRPGTHRTAGMWLVGGGVSRVLDVVALAALGAAVLLCLRRGGPARVVTFGALCLPLVMAISPSSAEWTDGRAGVLVAPMVALVVLAGLEHVLVPESRSTGGLFRPGSSVAGRRRRLCRGVATLAAAGCGALTIAAWVQLYGPVGGTPAAFAQGWHDPGAPLEGVVAKLEAQGVKVAWAADSLAYPLDIAVAQHGGKLVVAPVGKARDAALAGEASVNTGISSGPAFLFGPGPAALLNGVGPAAVEVDLQAINIGWRVVHAGPVTAVVATSFTTPAVLGATPQSYEG